MLKRLFFITLLAAVMLLTIGCGINIDMDGFGVTRGSGELVTEERPVSGFSGVRLNGIGELIITQGSQESLTIEAEDNILPELVSEVHDGILVLGFEDDMNWTDSVIPSKTITFTLQVKDLSSLEINGANTTNINTLQTGNLDIQVNGLGEITIDSLTVDELSIEISGGGRCDISGTADRQIIEVNGAGSLDAGDMETSYTSIKIAGAGDATVWARDSLEIDISGTGNVDYYGDPSINQNISGAGSISNLGEK